MTQYNAEDVPLFARSPELLLGRSPHVEPGPPRTVFPRDTAPTHRRRTASPVCGTRDRPAVYRPDPTTVWYNEPGRRDRLAQAPRAGSGDAGAPRRRLGGHSGSGAGL